MNLLRTAIQDLLRCPSVLIRYVVVVAGIAFSFRFAHQTFVGDAAPILLPPMAVSFVRLVLALYLALFVSAAQAMYFSVLGVEIGKPLWKCTGPYDGLRRFFIPWLIINLSAITLIDLQQRLQASGANDIVQLLEISILFMHVLAIPAGAAVMYWGALEWHQLGATFKPLFRFIGLTAIPLGMGLAQYAAHQGMLWLIAFHFSENKILFMAFQSAIDLMLLAVDGILFSLTWHICMLNSTTPEEEDIPFDI